MGNTDGARISRLHSTYGKVEKFDLLVQFFLSDYFAILESFHLNVMFQVDVLATGAVFGVGAGGGGFVTGIGEDDGSWDETDSGDVTGGGGFNIGGGGGGAVAIRGEISIYVALIARLSLFGFDQITALSEEAINSVFATLYTDARLRNSIDYTRVYQWSAGKAFTASFRGIAVKLLSGNKAVVAITIDSGVIQTRK